MKYNVLKLLIALFFLTLQIPTSIAASFDCTKAGTQVEKLICSTAVLGELDVALSTNYKNIRASNIGDSAGADLLQTQREWMRQRNTCSSADCIERIYRKRLDEICSYPVLSGIHPPCKYSAEIGNKPTANWTASEKRGDFYYVMSAGNINLVLYCPTKMGSQNERTTVLLVANDELIEPFKIQVDKSIYEGPFSTDNRMEDASLIYFIEMIRNSDFKISFGHKNYVISKSNAADVIPAFDPLKFHCNLFHNTNDVGAELNQLLQGFERSKPVSSSADVRDSLVKGVEYAYYDDGSCRAGSNKVCVTSNDFLQLCGQDKIQLSNYAVRTLGLYNSDFRILSQNSVRWKLNFDLNASTPCALYVTASGILRGNSRQITILAIPNGFKLNDDGNLFISTLRFMYELN